MKSLILLSNLLLVIVVEGNRRHNWRSPAGLTQYDDSYNGFDDYAQNSPNNEFEDFIGTSTIPTQLNPTTEHLKAPVISSVDKPEVLTPVGNIQGKKIQLDGKTVYAFLGIPFAQPPLGDLRFKRPVPADKFETLYDATNLPNACLQEKFDVFKGFSGESMWNPNTNISEDCLYLNLWVPEEVIVNKDTALVNVLFWIYGGGFISGSSSIDIYNGAQLALQENVVVVSSQYRLGPLGFMFFGTDDSPGNVGLFDQSMALEWVNHNAKSFGGDPNSVTLFGESAGAVSVSYHLLSTASRSYFKRAVMMSAAPTAPVYGFIHPITLKNRSYKLAKLAGCDIQKSIPEIVSCMRTKDAVLLTSLQWQTKTDGMLDFGFKPTIDGKFINDFPANIINNGEAKRADLMIGSVANEGSFFIVYEYLKHFHHNKSTNVSQDLFIEIMRDLFKGFSRLEQEIIISHYTNWENPEDGLKNQQKISEAVGDYYFVCPIRKFADAWSNRGLKVFYYHFTQRSSSNPWADWMGVLHGDDIEYFFGQPLRNSSPLSYTPGEKQLSIYITRLLSSFARTGTPSENWERYNSEVPLYLDLNGTHPSDKTDPNKLGPRSSDCALWNKILPKIRQSLRRGSHFRGGQPALQQQYQHFDLPSPTVEREYWGGQGVHGGHGFHFDSMSQCPCRRPHSQRAHPHIPVAPGALKKFGSSNSSSPSSEQQAPIPQAI